MENARTFSWRAAAIIFILALVLRVGYIIHQDKLFFDGVAENPSMFGQEAGAIAVHLVKGHGFASPFTDGSQPSFYTAPIYPLLIAAPLYISCGDIDPLDAGKDIAYHIMLAINVLASALLPVVGGLIGARLHWPRPVIIITAVLLCFSPQAFRAVGIISDGPLFALGTAAVLLLMCHFYTQQSRWWHALLVGGAIGLLTLLNPTMCWPLLAAYAILRLIRLARGSIAATFAALLLVGASTAIVVSPWLVRNKIADPELPLGITHNAGMLRWSAINDIMFLRHDNGAVSALAIHPWHGSETLRTGDGFMSEPAFNALCERRTQQKIKRGEVKLSEHMSRQVSAFWTSYHEALRWRKEPWSPAWIQGGIAALGILGFLVSRRKIGCGPWLAMLAIAAIYPINFYPIEGAAAHRHPLDLLLFIGIAWLLFVTPRLIIPTCTEIRNSE